MSATGDRSIASRAIVAAGLVLLVLGLIAWLWSGDWRWALTGLAGLLVGTFAAGVTANRKPTSPPAPAAVDNAIAATLTAQYGFLPLSVRYGAAKQARQVVEGWRSLGDTDDRS